MKSTLFSRGAIALIVALLVALGLGVTGCGSTDDAAPVATATTVSGDANGVEAVVFRSPTCGCCKAYEEYLGRHGFRVLSEVTDDMDPVKEANGVPADAEGCHTTLIENYTIEGHVPVDAIQRLLDERPDIDGIAVPGMPGNSPGMGEPNGEPLEVFSIDDGRVAPFMSV